MKLKMIKGKIVNVDNNKNSIYPISRNIKDLNYVRCLGKNRRY